MLLIMKFHSTTESLLDAAGALLDAAMTNILTAEDVLDNFSEFKDKLKDMPTDRTNALIAKIAEWSKDNDMTLGQAKNIKAWSTMMGDELLVHLWNQISGTQNLSNIQKLHKLIGSRIVEAVNVSRNLKK